MKNEEKKKRLEHLSSTFPSFRFFLLNFFPTEKEKLSAPWFSSTSLVGRSCSPSLALFHGEEDEERARRANDGRMSFAIGRRLLFFPFASAPSTLALRRSRSPSCAPLSCFPCFDWTRMSCLEPRARRPLLEACRFGRQTRAMSTPTTTTTKRERRESDDDQPPIEVVVVALSFVAPLACAPSSARAVELFSP